MILSSLVCSLLAPWATISPISSRFFSPLMGSRVNVSNRNSFACGLLAPWVAASPTHNQGTSSPQWAVGKNVSSKVKGHRPKSDSIVTKIMKTKSGDHREITHGIELKQHKLIGYISFQIHSLYPDNFRKILNN